MKRLDLAPFTVSLKEDQTKPICYR